MELTILHQPGFMKLKLTMMALYTLRPSTTTCSGLFGRYSRLQIGPEQGIVSTPCPEHSTEEQVRVLVIMLPFVPVTVQAPHIAQVP